MKKTVKKALVLGVWSIAISLLTTGSVFAHVTVKPGEVPAGKYTTFSVNVPNERPSEVVKIELELPDGLASVMPNVKPGWQITTEKSGDSSNDHHDNEANLRSITWSNGSIPVGQRDEFVFSAKTPAEPGQLIWKAHQTYADGTVVLWDKTDEDQPKSADGSPDYSESGPFSVTSVVASDATLDHDDAQTSAGDADSSTNRSLYVAISALVVAFISLIIATRHRN